MSNKEPDFGGPMVFAVAAIPIGIIVADLVGRLRALFIHEWPHISWGLFLIAVTTIVVHFFREALKFTHGFETETREQAQALKSFVHEQLQDISNFRRSTSEDVKRVEREFSELRCLCHRTIAKVNELLAQKGPVASEPPAEIPDTIQDAVSEIVEGSRS